MGPAAEPIGVACLRPHPSAHDDGMRSCRFRSAPYVPAAEMWGGHPACSQAGKMPVLQGA